MATKVGMISLGCCKNRVDSEVLLGMLAKHGYEIVSDPAEAEIIFVNKNPSTPFLKWPNTRRRASSKSCS